MKSSPLVGEGASGQRTAGPNRANAIAYSIIFVRRNSHDLLPPRRVVEIGLELGNNQTGTGYLPLLDSPFLGQGKVDLSFIIVNYFNSRTLTDCLDSIYKTVNGIEFEVLVINNSAKDEGIRPIEQSFPQARFINNPDNLGFAKANNQGARLSKGDSLFFVNPDAILTDGAARSMLDHLKSNPETGILGPKVLDPAGGLQFSCRTFPTAWSGLFNRYSLMTRLFPDNRFSKHYLMSDIDHNETREVDWVSGCCMAIPRQAFESAGQFDENYFLFIEDVDLCQAMKQKGYKVVYYPFARIYHQITSSNGKMEPGTIIKRHLGMSYYNRKHRQGNFLTRAVINFFISLRCFSQLVLNLFR